MMGGMAYVLYQAWLLFMPSVIYIVDRLPAPLMEGKNTFVVPRRRRVLLALLFWPVLMGVTPGVRGQATA